MRERSLLGSGWRDVAQKLAECPINRWMDSKHNQVVISIVTAGGCQSIYKHITVHAVPVAHKEKVVCLYMFYIGVMLNDMRGVSLHILNTP